MAGARVLILRAMLKGRKITAHEADRIGKTHEGGRRIRQLRETFPILKEPVAGKRYYRYFIDPEYLKEYRRKRLVFLCEEVKSIFR